MRLVLIKAAVASGMFESEAAVRGMIARGELRLGREFHQEKPGGRIRLDLDACVEKFTTRRVESPFGLGDRIPVRRGGLAIASAHTGGSRGV